MEQPAGQRELSSSAFCNGVGARTNNSEQEELTEGRPAVCIRGSFVCVKGVLACIAGFVGCAECCLRPKRLGE